MATDVFAFIDQLLGEAIDHRSKRQVTGVRKWVAKDATGTLEWPTGVGKTRAATIAIKLLRRDTAARKVIIVVPRIALKEQWERGLAVLGMLENTEVWVINSLIKKTSILCSLLILDEVHRYAAKTFAKVFDVIKPEPCIERTHPFILGLTAALKRGDGKHNLLAVHAPIVDRITMMEAIRNNYVAPFREFNLGVEMTIEDREKYREMGSAYGYATDKFNGDFDLIKSCAGGGPEPRLRGNEYIEPEVVKYAIKMGWRGNSAYKAYQIKQMNKVVPKAERQSVWGGDDHPYAPRKLFIWALNALRYSRKIREFTCNYWAKTDAAEQILRLLPGKAISFGEVIAPAEVLKGRLGDSVVLYHSKMKIKDRRESLRKIAEDPATRGILTARALDEGVDLPTLQLGLILSRSASQTQYLQRVGRVIRRHIFEDGTEKVSIIIHIYLKDTKDYNSLKASQKPTQGTQRWIESIPELIEAVQAIAA
jgi:superfamily II DNA or RNA helicase